MKILPDWMVQLGGRVAEINGPDWLMSLRNKQWETFLSQGLPTNKQERWKYTDLNFLMQQPFNKLNQDISDAAHLVKQHRLSANDVLLIVLVNGQFVPSLSDPLPIGLIIKSLSAALETDEELIKQQFEMTDRHASAFVSLNTAVFSDGLFLHLAPGSEVEKPIQLLCLNKVEDDSTSQFLHFIMLEEHSKLTILETQIDVNKTAYFANTVTRVNLGQNAALTYYKTYQTHTSAAHIAHTFIQQAKDSQSSFTNLISGSQFVRDDLTVALQEEGAECNSRGFYHLQLDNQYVDQHIDIKHSAPRTRSEMLHKGIVDQKARAVFNGRLHVAQAAQKVQAYQANHNVLLSNQAEVYSKPELEIYANDVVCKHGATTGQLDEEALFYLRARGIPEATAQQMLLQGFANEIMQSINPPVIKQYMQAQLSFVNRGCDNDN